MTYSETLDWMYAQLPMYQKQGKSAYHAKLDNIRALVDYLGHPEHKFPSIHVAGTNGKGSSSHLLASVLQEAGYRTGLYTSPHLKDFRERIRVDGIPVSEEEVVDFIREHQNFLEAQQLSFFELTVGMAFDYFAKCKVDIAVIEVGLGGRLDSTNIIRPEVSLITNIGMDHTDMLGDTIEAITREKGGIIKPGVPVVISEWQEQTASEFAHIAASMGAPISWASEKIKDDYPCGLLGKYQQRNVRGVIATLRLLRRFKIDEGAIRRGLQKVVRNTGLLGRWQIVQEKPRIIFDTAHNKEGLELTMAQLLEEPYENLHLVLGFVKDKDLRPILELLPSEAFYYFSQLQIPRGLDVDILAEKAAAQGIKGHVFSSVEEAFNAAKIAAGRDDVIYLGGSTFTVAEAL